jgi:hypothetical protein
MPIPKPSKGQSQSDYMSECMSFLKDENKFDSHEQRVAVCLSTWRRNNENTLVNRMNLILQEQDEKECPPGKKW